MIESAAIGIMQGRLLPPFEGRFQAFPADRWREEFPRAAAAGLACIEWIYELPHEADNPLATDAGIAELKRLESDSGVAVASVCADYFMTETLVKPDGSVDDANLVHLLWLITRLAALGATHAVLPFVDASALRGPAQLNAAAAALRRVAPMAATQGVELHLECDLPPPAFRALLEAIDHPAVKANYDIGNSASLGYAPAEELPVIGPWLGSVHVKDRARGGGTLPLGQGEADLAEAFRQIKKLGYTRPLILQVAREEAIDPVELAARNRMIVQRLWTEDA